MAGITTKANSSAVEPGGAVADSIADRGLRPAIVHFHGADTLAAVHVGKDGGVEARRQRRGDSGLLRVRRRQSRPGNLRGLDRIIRPIVIQQRLVNEESLKARSGVRTVGDR